MRANTTSTLVLTLVAFAGGWFVAGKSQEKPQPSRRDEPELVAAQKHAAELAAERDHWQALAQATKVRDPGPDEASRATEKTTQPALVAEQLPLQGDERRRLKYHGVRPYRAYRAYRVYKQGDATQRGSKADCSRYPVDDACRGTEESCRRDPDYRECYGTELYCQKFDHSPYCVGTAVFCRTTPEHPSCAGTAEWCQRRKNQEVCRGTKDDCERDATGDACLGTPAYCRSNADQHACANDEEEP